MAYEKTFFSLSFEEWLGETYGQRFAALTLERIPEDRRDATGYEKHPVLAEPYLEWRAVGRQRRKELNITSEDVQRAVLAEMEWQPRVSRASSRAARLS